MTKIAITLNHDSNIFEIDLATSTPKAIFEALYPVTTACLGGGSFVYLSGNGNLDIYREDPPYEPHSFGPDKLVYTHDKWIRDIEIRYQALRYNFFFSAYYNDTAVRIFYLDEMDNPVTYCTINGDQLMFTDPCNPDSETYWSTWGGNFTFDDANNMYITTGNKIPSGIYRIQGAGSETVTGEVERIVSINGDSTSAIEFIGNNQLLYVQGNQKIYSLNLQTLESSLVYDVAQFSHQDITSIALITSNTKKFDIFKKKKKIFKKKHIHFK